jgi:putative nucleotidyltransferase with HDIG domain/PAS domain S-box-containing protein
MNQEQLLYLIPYAGSLGISMGILVFVWIRRDAHGATAFFWYIFGQTLYILGNILETISPDLAGKLFWESFQWVVASLPVIAFPFFVIQYIEYKLRYDKKLFAASLLIPLAFSFLVVTDRFHHLIYINPRVLQNGLFTSLIYDYGPVFTVYSIYVYLVAFISCTLLVLRMMQPHNLYRIQIAFILSGLLLPIAGSMLSLMGLSINSQRDISPLSAALGNFLLAWGFYRFRIFDVLPIARDQIFEAMVEPVVIVDKKNNIVDINSSMLAMINKTAAEVIGAPAALVFESFPIAIKQPADSSYARTEASFELGGINIDYETTVWPLYNARREMIGRIYISHDITELKQLENELRKLNTQLESNVIARTHELAQAYDITLEGWARALELRDKDTEGHTRRVADTTLKIASKLNFPQAMMEHIRRGAILHDIGKMAIPDDILHKPGPLNPEEREIVKKHPETAYKLLKPIRFLEQSLDIPYCHHEKWDGTGYPRQLKGGEIPVAARIFAIADVWDALGSERLYNKAWPREDIIAYFVEQSGRHFDPRLVEIFLEMVEKGEI